MWYFGYSPVVEPKYVDKINNKLNIGQMTPRGVRSYQKKSPMNPTWGDTFFWLPIQNGGCTVCPEGQILGKN